MALPIISDIFSLHQRDVSFLDIQNINMPAAQSGRVLVIAVVAVSTIQPTEVVTDITSPGASLGNGILQIDVDRIIANTGGNTRYAMAGLYYIKNAQLPTGLGRIQIFTGQQVRELFACVYSVTGVQGEVPHSFRGGIDATELNPDATFGSNLTTTVSDCIVVDSWAMYSENQPVATLYQTLVALQEYSRGASILTQKPQLLAGVTTFTQQIDQPNLARAFHIVSWAGPSAPPTAVNAGGPYQGEIGSPIAIAGTWTDGDITPVTVLWEIVSGGTGTFGNASAATTTFTPDVVGTYQLKFSVDDGDNPPVAATAALTSDPVPPTNVSAGGPYVSEVGVPSAILGTFTAGTDPVPTLTWTIVSGGTGTFGNTAFAATTFAADSIGPYVLRFQVNPIGSPPVEAMANFDSTVVPPKNLSIGGPYAGESNSPIQLAPSVDLGTDQNPAYHWQVISGGAGAFSNNASFAPTFTPGQVGPYVLQLSVTPSVGNPVISEGPLSSTDIPPFGVNAGGPYSGVVGSSIRVNANFFLGTLPATSLWTITSGGTGTFDVATDTITQFTPDDVGTYVLRFTVDDTVTPIQFAETTLESTPVTPPIVDSGGPYDAEINLPEPIEGIVIPGDDPNPAIMWTQVSGTLGVFADATALNTTFRLDVVEIVTIRLTATPAVGPPVFHDSELSTADCKPPPLSLRSVTHLVAEAYVQYTDPPPPAIYLDGDWGIIRLRFLLSSDFQDDILLLNEAAGETRGLYLSADRTTYFVTDSTGATLDSVVLDITLPLDTLILLGIRIEKDNVATGAETHKIFFNNTQIGQIVFLAGADAGKNDPGRMLGGRAGVNYLSFQYQHLKQSARDFLITAPVGEGQGALITAMGTDCLNYPTSILVTTQAGNVAAIPNVDFTWNFNSTQHNDSMLQLFNDILDKDTLNDGQLEFYRTRGATSENAIDAEREFLLAQGIAPAHHQDMWLDFLRNIPSVTLAGTISEMKAQWWALGAPIR